MSPLFCAVTNQKMSHNEENWLPGHFWRQHGQQSGARRALRASSPQRPTCSRRIPYIPAAVLATWFRLLISATLILLLSHAVGDYRSRLCRHFSGRDTIRAGAAPPAVADNTLTIKQKSTLPVSKTRQDKSLFRSLSDTSLPPANPTRCAPRRQREHRAFVKQCPRPTGS